MKKFDKLVVQSFAGPYMLSFFVAEFVLVMQFLWKYIDEILGKGFSLFELLELVLYFMVTQIPMALPIAILISSVMVFGNMSERYELSSMKSAGVSLMRIMRPGIAIALATGALSLLASNYLKPQANFQFQKRFLSMQSQKPSLTIEEKIFNKDFKGFAIRVAEKDQDGERIRDVSMYDHTQVDKSLLNFIKADSGRMYNSDDGLLFVMELYDGTQYMENKRKKGKDNKKKYPLMRTQFETWRKSFDLGQFDTDDNGIQISRNKEDMLNTVQLLDAIDSVDMFRDKLRYDLFDKDDDNKKNKEEQAQGRKQRTTEAFQQAIKKQKVLTKGKANTSQLTPKIIYQIDKDSTTTTFSQLLTDKDFKRYMPQAIKNSGRMRDRLRSTESQMVGTEKRRSKYLLRLNQQYAFAIICIVFMFIGAPLGSIIRKGGYGYPLLFAILFYMVFIIMTIMGEKLVRSGSMDPILAAWFANLLVLPVAILLSYMALRDIKMSALNPLRYFTKVEE